MECLFAENLNKNNSVINLTESECRHVKSLRLDSGDKAVITNGLGLTAEVIITRTGKESYRADCINFFENYNELHAKISIALPILDSRDRFEFSVEKAVELGAIEIIPFTSEYSSNVKFSIDRTQSKILAALKQCKRSRLPICKNVINFMEINFNDYDMVLYGDDHGESISQHIDPSLKILTVCGPEGGLSESEIKVLENLTGSRKVKASVTRLRSETASIALLTLVVNQIML